jgi:hypothetical protein
MSNPTDGYEIPVEPKSLAEVFQRMGWDDPITSPFPEFDGTIMVVGTSGGHGVVGSVDEYPDNLGDVYVRYPLAYQEAPDIDRSTGQIRGVNIGMSRILNGTSMCTLGRFKMDYLAVLRKGSPKDEKLVSNYKEIVTAAMAADSGIMAPPSGFTGRGSGLRS